MEACGTVSIVPITLAKNPICMNTLRPGMQPTQGTSVKTVTRLLKLRTLGGITSLNIVCINYKRDCCLQMLKLKYKVKCTRMDNSGFVLTVRIKAAGKPTSESTLKPGTFPTQDTSASFARRFPKPKILSESISQHTIIIRNIRYMEIVIMLS